ncbi:hypothetical protein ISF_00717 [Cordyceps fumosorosea ARSEF 2679]|uniref:SMODS and SLOG-associating 2TM effector domain-containing protein n=1 Tax=Cordyceps fumosorosea (strain ARSEF 2679) TaxID=1081104 RepID=A0A168EHM7_CORFA|nr:hypothetical protein ISF_00717 [Cordyceps fumosorosea ARSEF 2679]OAA73816.1 hypothetical protein ISF_00717 [Cordyceps fumosorosea ARSEF 2679]
MPSRSAGPSNLQHEQPTAPENRHQRRASPPKPPSPPHNRTQRRQPNTADDAFFFPAMEDEERQPLIPRQGGSFGNGGVSVGPPPAAGGDDNMVDHHAQFCRLVGVRPLNHPHEESHRAHPQSLYVRAVARRQGQSLTYVFTATLVNTLLLTQIVLGAALTGLGASNSSRVLITVFGALNTVIAGVVAFLKSRGQPMRARMFRDDLSRVVDEIENSAVMWFGISQGAHGYGAIDTDEQVTVRGEVARLTRLYDKAVKNNTMNDPDMYNANGAGDSFTAGLRKAGAAPPPPAGPAINAAVAAPPDFSAGALRAPPPAADPDASPASKAPEPAKPKSDANSDKGSVASKKADLAPAATPAPEDAAPATPAKPAADAPADAPAADAPAAAPNPAAETPKAAADDKPAAAAAAAAAPPPAVNALQGHVSQDPDESPASSASPPKREPPVKTLVDVT